MIERAELDLQMIREESDLSINKKYRDGNKEHGGDLLDMTLLEYLYNALDENTDQRVYLIKAIKKAEASLPVEFEPVEMADVS